MFDSVTTISKNSKIKKSQQNQNTNASLMVWIHGFLKSFFRLHCKISNIGQSALLFFFFCYFVVYGLQQTWYLGFSSIVLSLGNIKVKAPSCWHFFIQHSNFFHVIQCRKINYVFALLLLVIDLALKFLMSQVTDNNFSIALDLNV